MPDVSYFQICCPVTASSAYTPLAALKYMTLSTTSGVLSKKPDLSPVWKVQARLKSLTFDVLICASVENFVPPGSWPNDTQLFCPDSSDDHRRDPVATTINSFFISPFAPGRHPRARAPSGVLRNTRAIGTLELRAAF